MRPWLFMFLYLGWSAPGHTPLTRALALFLKRNSVSFFGMVLVLVIDVSALMHTFSIINIAGEQIKKCLTSIVSGTKSIRLASSSA